VIGVVGLLCGRCPLLFSPLFVVYPCLCGFNKLFVISKKKKKYVGFGQKRWILMIVLLCLIRNEISIIV
jgi:hypothetical protein